MDHDWELSSPILEILEIGVSNILYNPRNIAIWKPQFFPCLLCWKYWKLKSPLFPGSWKYGRRAGGGGRAAPGVVLCCLGLFLEHVPAKTSMVTLELRSKQALFWKWLHRPNHYAHKICIEILCRTPVSILKYLSPRPQNHVKNLKYSFLAWMSTWISKCRRRRRRRRPNNYPIWQEP